jgi:hypothetical protein
MTRTIGIVAAIAACCLHLGAPTAAGTKTRGNGGSDPDIGHNGPSSGMVPARTCRRRFVHMKTWLSIVALAVALSPGTARAGSKVLATGPAAYAGTPFCDVANVSATKPATVTIEVRDYFGTILNAGGAPAPQTLAPLTGTYDSASGGGEAYCRFVVSAGSTTDLRALGTNFNGLGTGEVDFAVPAQ